MPTAEIITIGTELLLGEIVDTNTQFIARLLSDNGIDLYRSLTVGDNVHRIAGMIREAKDRCDIVITTGGLGPTIDDPTREAMAKAFNQELIYQEALWEQIQERFAKFKHKPTENNRRQAYIPSKATPITNPVGTAPAFLVEEDGKLVISLPGVPKEMEFLMHNEVIPRLHQKYRLTSRIFTKIIHTSGIGESQIDKLLGDLERLSNPTVGLAAHTGQVDIRISAKAESNEAASQLLDPVETKIRRKLGRWIYGTDGDTLEKVALQTIREQHWGLAVVEVGFGGELARKLYQAGPQIRTGHIFNEDSAPKNLIAYGKNLLQHSNAEVALLARIIRTDEEMELQSDIITPFDITHMTRNFGGPPALATVWATNYCLDMLRNIKIPQNK